MERKEAGCQSENNLLWDGEKCLTPTQRNSLYCGYHGRRRGK
ncbi:hypothetical protein RUMHYD_02656 [Blautia hydrogenotrophica DSM 10507]|uniref:Uncharacterized protein n=1 Tax=Blautia hydrogenotrophica (strain DSM 10507 / JCM 14656 / S5a33) TaxID=476272 RepID=C0CP55_BLAHS|nr:hypothetical protein RUMHYD_02656 [Blautia hydrogenotrophica DSM 10507]